MKKRIILFVILISLFSIVAEAAFSGKYLCVRRGTATYYHRLYGSTTDVGSPRIATRASGTTFYAKLSNLELSGLQIKVRVSGVSKPVADFAFNSASNWGSYGTGNGQFYNTMGIAIDSSGNSYITDAALHRVTKLDASGAYVAKWGSYGTGNGYFNEPRGIAVDGGGDVYVVDGINDRVQVFSSAGTYLRTIGSSGSTDGKFTNPYGIAIQNNNYVVVQDGDGRLQWFSKAGAFVSKATPTPSAGSLGIAICPISGDIFVTSASKVIRLTSSGSYQYEASISGAYAIAFDQKGYLFLGNSSGDIVQYVPRPASLEARCSYYAMRSSYIGQTRGFAFTLDGNLAATTNSSTIQRVF